MKMLLFASRKKFEVEVAKRAAEACDQIMTQMGADLHDDLIQKLTNFRLYMDRIERASKEPAEIENLVLKMKCYFEQVIRSIKSTSRSLLPARTEGETLVGILEMLFRNLEQPGTGHIHFTTKGEPTPLTEQVEMHIVRIVQELIHNAFKHSSAWHVWVRLQYQPDKLVIEVEDDGSGVARKLEFTSLLKKKYNTLKMRSQAIGASIDYVKGTKGLLATLTLPITV